MAGNQQNRLKRNNFPADFYSSRITLKNTKLTVPSLWLDAEFTLCLFEGIHWLALRERAPNFIPA